MSYEAHPAADLFPMMGEDDLNALAEDIHENGLNEPIILHAGKILDGRNRQVACGMVGVEPKFVEWDGRGGTPTEFVISQNLHRRHLSTSQRAAIAVEMLPQLEEEARERMAEAGRSAAPGRPAKVASKDAPFIGNPDEPVTVEPGPSRSSRKAAQLFNVGSATVDRAKAVKKSDPEAFEQIKRGDTLVTTEYKRLRPAPTTNGESEVYVPQTQRQREYAEAQKRRMIEGLSHTDGVCRGLRDLKIPMVAAACDADELNEWAKKAGDIAKEFNTLKTRLREAIQ